MMWRQTSPTTWEAEYCGYTITKTYLYTEQRYLKDKYNYLAVKGNKRHETANWELMRSRLLKTTQTTINF